MDTEPLSLLNTFEVENAGTTRHLVCLMESVAAGSTGIPTHAIVGEYTPAADGNFDPQSFHPNPEFIAAFAAFMNAEALRAPELIAQAEDNPDDLLYLVDPRTADPDGDIPAADILGSFQVDSSGRIIPGSFKYHPDHTWLDPDFGPSALLNRRDFHDWLHRDLGEFLLRGPGE